MIADSLNCQDPHCQDPQHRTERDSYVLDILSAIIETSHEMAPLSGERKTLLTLVRTVQWRKISQGGERRRHLLKKMRCFGTVSGSLQDLLPEDTQHVKYHFVHDLFHF